MVEVETELFTQSSFRVGQTIIVRPLFILHIAL
ncbi:MAG: hypothetical protein ThorAB25_22520 [Candidatus Thorarchaeota archaeon AB_25]|nr:MAG: hypothetical protein ThorAB25_22520 [Candidatus Thorarchaeota archaeon AB_25]